MIEIILIIFCVIYYLFSLSFCVAYTETAVRDMSLFGKLCSSIIVVIAAPIGLPIIGGMELGIRLKI